MGGSRVAEQSDGQQSSVLRGRGARMRASSSDTSLGTFKALNNLVVHNGRQGIRWENVPSDNAGGEALIEGNRVHENNLVA